MRLRLGIAAVALMLAALPGPDAGNAADASSPREASDLAAARRVFEANLDAIRRRDRDAYLACYFDSPRLARTGPAGFELGFDSLRSSAGSGWPDVFDARDLRLTWLADGVVYGTYRYRVRYGADEQSGISERVFRATEQGWKIAVTTAFPELPGTPPPPRAIVGATLIDGTGRTPVRDAVVILRDGKIEAAGPRSRVRVPAGIDTLDARGCWLLPGLVDAHVHYSQTGWADGRPDALDLRAAYPYEETISRLRRTPQRFHRAFLASGVTAVFDVGGYPWTFGLAREAERSTEAPHVSAAGPLLSTLDHWLNLPAEKQFIHLTDSASAVSSVKYLKTRGASAVKVWFINRPGMNFGAMERAVTVAGAEARRAELPLIVHATGLAEAKAALRAGAKLLVHSVDDRAVDSDFLSLAKRNGTIYCPTLTVREGYVRMSEAAQGSAARLDDPNDAVDSLTRALIAGTASAVKRLGITPRNFRKGLIDSMNAMMAANLRAVHRAGIPIAMGTDAGNPLTLHGPSAYAEMEAMQKAGMPASAVIVAATRNGARAMGRDSEFGTVEVGRLADLVIVGADPLKDIANLRRLRWVVRGGVVRSREEMRAVVQRARY